MSTEKERLSSHREPWTETEVGKDEMNFAEFPLGFLSERVPKGCSSFVVEDRVPFHGKFVTRRMSVVPSTAYGFPVAKDREIITACVQATKRAGFPEDGRVAFSRYELIEVLGWDHGGGQYARLVEGLNRLKFTGYKWEGSWWDNDAKEWCDHSFSMLDNVVIAANDRGRQNGKPKRTSWLKWNEEVVSSFKAGFLKDLDLDTYRSLSSLLAKEMYRLLDKNFHWTDRLTYDLREFAFQKLGMRGKSYEGNVAKIKAALAEPIEELVSCGIIKSFPKGKRFVRPLAGDWQVVFEKGIRRRRNNGRATMQQASESSTCPKPEMGQMKKIVNSLTKRGLSQAAAVLFSLENSLESLQHAARAMDEQRKRGQTIRHPDRWFAAALDRKYRRSGEDEPSAVRPERRVFSGGPQIVDHNRSETVSLPKPCPRD